MKFTGRFVLVLASLTAFSACGIADKKDSAKKPAVSAAEANEFSKTLPAVTIVRVPVDANGREVMAQSEMRLSSDAAVSADNVGSVFEAAKTPDLKVDELDRSSSTESFHGWAYAGFRTYGYAGSYGYAGWAFYRPTYYYHGFYFNWNYAHTYNHGGYNYYQYNQGFNGSYNGYGQVNNYPTNPGYGQNGGYQQNPGYGQNGGYGQNAGYQQNPGYNQPSTLPANTGSANSTTPGLY